MCLEFSESTGCSFLLTHTIEPLSSYSVHTTQHAFIIEPSLKALLNELHPVCASWYNIGLELDIPYPALNCFKLVYSDQLDLMREMLMYWLDTTFDPRPTWEAVVKALRSPIVDKKNVADQLESKYCTPVHVMNKSKTSEGIATQSTL